MFEAILLKKHKQTNSDLEAVNKTLELLSGYHGMRMSHPIFMKQYKHLTQLQTQLAKEIKNV